MITYEVNTTVEPDLVPEYELFMRSRHVPDVLASACFLEATFERADGGRYRTRYEATDAEALEHYLARHAPRLRMDVAERFPSGLAITRETWTVVEHWPHL